MQLWGQQAPIWGNRPPPAHGWLGQTGTGWGLCCRPEKHAPPTLDTPRTLGILHAGAVGTSTPAVPSDGLCLHVLFLLREGSLNFIFRQYLKKQNPDSRLLVDRTDHSDLS